MYLLLRRDGLYAGADAEALRLLVPPGIEPGTVRIDTLMAAFVGPEEARRWLTVVMSGHPAIGETILTLSAELWPVRISHVRIDEISRLTLERVASISSIVGRPQTISDVLAAWRFAERVRDGAKSATGDVAAEIMRLRQLYRQLADLGLVAYTNGRISLGR